MKSFAKRRKIHFLHMCHEIGFRYFLKLAKKLTYRFLAKDCSNKNVSKEWSNKNVYKQTKTQDIKNEKTKQKQKCPLPLLR